MNNNNRFPAKSSNNRSISMADCDWLELPCDVVSVIIDKVISFSLSDYIRFGAVCTKWRCFCLENYQHIKIPNRTPILLKLPLIDNHVADRDLDQPQGESFYSLSERKGYYFQLPVPNYTNYCGSNFGWIITETPENFLGFDFFVRLLNPFKSVDNEIEIPSSLMFWEEFDYVKGWRHLPIKKAVLSASPSSNPNDFIVMAIRSDNTMGFYKSGDQTWTHVKGEVINSCQDVVYYKGQFFINTYNGPVIGLDSDTLTCDEPKFSAIIAKPSACIEHDEDIIGVHLVESSGDLLLVYRLFLDNNKTVVFQVFKLVEFTEWIEVNTLEGHILFLSKNGSMSVSASDLPGFKPNCIYFAGLQIVRNRPSVDRCLEGGHHMGIFNLEDRSFEPCYVMKSRDSMMAFSWILPTLSIGRTEERKAFMAVSLGRTWQEGFFLGSDQVPILYLVESDWSELPFDLLSLITNKLSSFSLSDYIRFGAVCVQWRSLEDYGHIKLPSQMPILLKLLNDENQCTETFCSISERKVYEGFQFPLPFYTDCRGSNFGWIITESEKDNSVQLLNPFRSINNEIQIPPSLTFWDELDHSKGGVYLPIKKAVLSASPSSNPKDFILVGICDNGTMGFYNSGGIAWTLIKRELEVISNVCDVIYYEGHFLAMTSNGSLVVIDSGTLHYDNKTPKVVTLIRRPPIETPGHFDEKMYLVESSGNLLLVYRIPSKVIQFKIFKLVGYRKWEEINTLDGHILFLGDNASMSIPASKFPGSKPNCIYFAGPRDWSGPRVFFDLSLVRHHMGIVNLEDGSFEQHYLMKSREFVNGLIWIQPSV